MSKQIKFKKISVVFAVSIFMFLFVGRCSAAEADQKGLQVSPVRFDVAVDPGQKQEGKIYVSNKFDFPITVEVDVQDFYIDDTNNKTDAKFFVPNENHKLKAYDIINWIDIDKIPFQLNPGEYREVPFVANIPQNTPTGGYYGVIFFKQKGQDENTTDGVHLTVENRLGVMMTFGVHGKEKIDEKGALSLFSPTRKVYIDNPIEFNVQAKNTGNIPYKIGGSVDVYRFGKKISSMDIIPRLLYPDRVRVLDNLVWNFALMDIGKYDAKVHMESEDGKVVIDGTTSFLIIPWKMLAVAFVIIIVIVIIFNIGIHSGKKKSKKQ